MSMQILFCNYEYPPLGGGGGVINALIAEELSKRHNVTVLTSQGLDLPAESIENNVQVVRAPVFFRKQTSVASMASMASYVTMGVKRGMQLLREHEFDVINTHFVLPTGPVGHILSRTSGIPNVLSLHGGDLYDPSKFLSPHRHLFLRWIVRRLLLRADFVVGQSNNTLNNMRTFYTPELAGIRIPLAIKRPILESVSRSDYGFEEDEVILITIGRLIPRKNIKQLVTIMPTFQGQPVRLVIVGSGPEESDLRQLANERGVNLQVTFAGYVEETEKYNLLQLADLFVSTSQHEGFGLVFLEAMACGLPVICYDHGGQTDFLQNGKTGYLVTIEDTTSFQEKCRQLIENADDRRAMGQYNLKLVEEFYIDHCARRYEQLFEQAVAARQAVKEVLHATRAQ
jgi:glycosyltransferase involved in cell wall biosynthesis